MQLTVSGRNLGPKLPEMLTLQEKGQVLIFKCWQVIQRYLEHCVGPTNISVGSSLAHEPPACSSALELVLWRLLGPFLLEWNINCIACHGCNFFRQSPNQQPVTLNTIPHCGELLMYPQTMFSKDIWWKGLNIKFFKKQYTNHKEYDLKSTFLKWYICTEKNTGWYFT